MTVLDWLLDADPAVRWQALRDLADAPEEQVRAERARTADTGWCARLLSLQREDGTWDGGAYYPDWLREEYFESHDGQPWTATAPTLLLLTQLGLDPASPRATRAVELVRDRVRWEHEGEPFFEGETEPCVNALTVSVGAYFGVPVDGVVDRLLGEQLEDGGWNCDAERGSTRSSFHTTIGVLEALLAWERTAAEPGRARAARARGEEYLLDRRLLRRASTGEVIDPSWTRFSFPVRWFYDVLRALDHLRSSGADPVDPRMAEALELVRSKREPDGTWLLENSHPGETAFALEDEGGPSRWNTLRALRVLRWAEPG